MSAHAIIDNAPVGSIVAWPDGTPQPPARFSKKLAAWRTSNSRGRPVRKQGGRGGGSIPRPPCFTLHEADYGAGGVVAIRVHRTFSVKSKLRFTIVERPAVRSVRVFDSAGEDAELVYLASNQGSGREVVADAARGDRGSDGRRGRSQSRRREGRGREELVAELGACFLSADLGIAPELEPRADHASYLASW